MSSGRLVRARQSRKESTLFALITNVPRAYHWGAPGAISELLGRVPTGAPEAELWLGTHHASPAHLAGGGDLVDVAGELPFLLKLLAAGQSLSLQVHPNSDQAEEGFEREEAAGIPIDAPERNYRDRSAKPELLYALTDVWALCGFRSAAAAKEALAPLSSDARLGSLLYRLDSDAALGPTVTWLLEHGPGADDAVAAISDGADRIEGPSGDVVRILSAQHPGDPGIAISLLLNTVVLRPGEALYLPAGNLHAYVNGTAIELMAPSDNVLRGGLTTKHVDIPELINVLDARVLPAPRVEPVELVPGLFEFAPEDSGLRLLVASTEAVKRGLDIPLVGPSIALALGGPVQLGEDLLPAGGAAYLDEMLTVHAAGTGLLAIASAARVMPIDLAD